MSTDGPKPPPPAPAAKRTPAAPPTKAAAPPAKAAAPAAPAEAAPAAAPAAPAAPPKAPPKAPPSVAKAPPAPPPKAAPAPEPEAEEPPPPPPEEAAAEEPPPPPPPEPEAEAPPLAAAPPAPPPKAPKPSDLPYVPVMAANREFAAPLTGLGIGGSAIDDEIKKLRRTSTPASRIFVAVVLLGMAGIGGFFLWNSNKFKHRFDRYNEIDQMTDQTQVVPALIAELRANTDRDVKVRILANLGHFRDPSAVDAIVEQLAIEGPVRREAAKALASIGLPGAERAKGPLFDVLPQTTTRDHGQVVWALVVLGESRAADAIVEAFSTGQLQTMDGFEPKKIARVVGVARLSSPTLINHQSAAVRLLVATTLSESATPEAAAPLRQILEGELARQGDARNSEVIRTAAAGLGRTGSPEAAAPLFRVLTQDASLRNDILQAIGKTTAAPQLASLVSSATNAEIKRELVKLLAATHDPRGADALAGQLTSDDPDTRSIAALGLAEVGDPRALTVLAELARSPHNDDVRRSALAALAFVASPDNARQMVTLMQEAPSTTASVLRALGRSREPSVAPTIFAQLEGPDSEPAAYALGELGDDSSYPRVIQLARRPQSVNMAASNDAERNSANQALIMSRRAAILALGRYGRTQAFDVLSQIVEDEGDDYELRSRAGQSLGQIATVEQLQTVIEKVKTAGVPNTTREYYAQALWQRPHAELSDALLGLVASALPDSLRTSAAVAVGYAALPASQPRLRELLQQEDTQRFAMLALGMMGDEEAIAEVKAVILGNPDLHDIFRSILDPEGNSAVQGNRIGVITADMFQSGAMYRRMAAAWYLRQGEGNDGQPYAWTHLLATFRLGYNGSGGANAHDIRELLWTMISTAEEPDARIMAGRMLLELGERGLLLRARDTEGPTEEAARFVLREAAAREARAASGGSGGAGAAPAEE